MADRPAFKQILGSRSAGASPVHRPLSMLGELRFSSIQIGLVLFWAIWLTVVTTANIFDAMKQLGALPAGFTLASYNFDLVKKTVGAHGVPTVIAALLFAAVIAWELLASALLWRAWLAMHRGAPGTAAKVYRYSPSRHEISQYLEPASPR